MSPLPSFKPFLHAAIFLLVSIGSSAAPLPLFNGKTPEGWEGDTSLWHIEDETLTAGTLERKQLKNDFYATVKDYSDFELTLKWRLVGTEGFVNGGIQFRSFRIPNNHEMWGYQADLGAGYDGALYDESRRGMLLKPSKEVYEKARKPLGEWNEYRIRAEGDRIQLWLNGVQTADYTETSPEIPRTGKIALQIHGNATSVVRYKDIVIDELPPGRAAEAPTQAPAPAPVSGPAARITRELTPVSKIAPFAGGSFALTTGDVVVFTGAENMVQEQHVGALESRLAQQWKNVAPRFRHMSWEGDTVFRQNRMMQWGSWPLNLQAAGATVVVAWFGQVEAMDATKSVEDFTKAYGELLDEFSKQTQKIVLIGPAPFEKPADPRVPDNTPLNKRVAERSEAARKLAQSRNLVFVDLFAALSHREGLALTRNGIHFDESGLATVGQIIAAALGASEAAPEPLRKAIVEKNRLWFDTWRCMNWAFAYGDRSNVAFAKSTDNHPPFAEELTKFQPLLAHADATVHALGADKPAPKPLPPEITRADPPATSPEDQISNFKMRDGFEVKLFADEKLGVVRPIQIRWDELGRLWVACTPAYPQLQPGEHGNDYILVLEDTDGDGRADKSWRFAENLTMPMGFEFAPKSTGGGIYLCETTQLVHLTDRRGTGKADGRTVLLSGFGTGDTHQDANSIRWGPDGNLWFSQGYHIWSYVETPHGLVELNRSGLWRYNPRTQKLDSFLNESGAGLNCWGTAWDDFGQMFHGSGADTKIWHSTPALIPTLHPQVLPTGIAASKGKSMEPEILSSSHLPEELRGVLLKSTYYTSQIQLYRLHDSGSTFVSEDLGDLMSGNNEFRPVETRVGPDGALYVCDWLNPVIGHYQASYRDPRRDRSHGRIWRVTAKDRPLIPKPQLAAKDATALISSLRSKERWERDTAKFALYRMDTAPVLAAASTALAGALSEGDTRLLYELSGVFAAHESPSPKILSRLMASSDFRERAWATHLVGLWANTLEDPLSLLQKAVTDEHPRVRLEAVVACAWVRAKDAPAALKIATLAIDKPTDPAIRHALTQCIHSLAPQWRPALAKGQLDFHGRYQAMALVLSTVSDTTMFPAVRNLIASGKLSTDDRDALLKMMIEVGTTLEAAYALSEAPDSKPVQAAVLDAARKAGGAGYGSLAQQLLEGSNTSARILACRIIAAIGTEKTEIAARIETILASEANSGTERVAAMGALAKIRGKAVLEAILKFADNADATLRLGALGAAASVDPAAVAKRCIPLLEKTHSSKEVAALVAPLLSQKTGSAELAKAVQADTPSVESAKRTLQWLAESGRDDSALRNALTQAAGLETANAEYSEALVKRWVAEASSHGDAKLGETVFKAAQTTCLSCHKVGNEGGILGPELSAIGRAMTPEMIVESVLWPKRQVKEGYMLTQITTKEGLVQQGYKAAETQETLTLKDLAGNPTAPILKTRIATRSDAGSLMPDGLMALLGEKDQLNLFKYLFELGK